MEIIFIYYKLGGTAQFNKLIRFKLEIKNIILNITKIISTEKNYNLLNF